MHRPNLFLAIFRRGFGRYYASRSANPFFHAMTHGGNRSTRWTATMRAKLVTKLGRVVDAHPLYNRRELAVAVGHGVNAMWVWRTLRQLNITLKLVEYHNTNKYSLHNTIRYHRWLCRVHTIPWVNLKFADESHFTSRGNILSYHNVLMCVLHVVLV